MIHPDSISLEWIRQASVKNNYNNLIIIEKTIRAFCLLEALVKSGCPFIFKGGSALMLHMKGRKRMSVDIDIICPPGTNVENYLWKYATNYGFSDIKLEERISRTNIIKTHAKFYYTVSYLTNKDKDAILLDVLFEDSTYTKIESLPIENPFLKQEGEPIMVNVPSLEDMLGDKLTAFAPNTTGIPYYKGERRCSMKIIKQLYDIASLFDVFADLTIVSNTFTKIAKVELEYRGKDPSNMQSVLDDILCTAEHICTGIYSKEKSYEEAELANGILRIRDLIHSEPYNQYSAAVNASKAAYLSALISKGKTSFERYNSNMSKELKNKSIDYPLSKSLNRIKTIIPEAFFYWLKTQELLVE